MKLFHLTAVRHHPPEIREEYPTLAEYEKVFAALSRRFETVFVYRQLDTRKETVRGRE